MSLKINTIDHDDVINSIVLTGKTTYGFAIEKLFPLINRFSAQRKLQNPSFYDRLRRDILKGCLMPPITLALVETTENLMRLNTIKKAQVYANNSISNGFVLDGTQRLNTLDTIKNDGSFLNDKTLFINLIISSNKDMLLYRMITLNNGQKPMSPRHQIEVLTSELFDFNDLDMDVQSEKDRAERIKRGAFNLADISKGYLAFFTNKVHNENNKIISEKMDEIIVGRILTEAAVESGIEFQQILNLIDGFVTNEKAKYWLKVQNNLIGFCVGVKKSFDIVSSLNPDEFGYLTEKFDEAFKGIDAAKVNIGKFRRELSKKFIEEIERLKDCNATELLTEFSDATVQ